MEGLLSTLQQIDTRLIIAINSHHCEWADMIMWWMSDKWIWIPFYLLLAWILFKRIHHFHFIIAMVAIGLAIYLSDHICASTIRPFVQRLRPSNPDNPISSMIHLVNGYTGGRYGFPSCHAANTFALATILTLIIRDKSITVALFVWAFLVSYSRIYLGVHYPGDILGGMIWGIAISWLLYFIYRLCISTLITPQFEH